jgi:hypothetical protein
LTDENKSSPLGRQTLKQLANGRKFAQSGHPVGDEKKPTSAFLRLSRQGDRMSPGKKIAPNVAQPIFLSKFIRSYPRGKRRPKQLGIFCYLKKNNVKVAQCVGEN